MNTAPGEVKAAGRPPLARPVTFGLSDGLVCYLGVVLGLLAHPSLILPVAIGGRSLRLVRHDTVMGRFYRLYPVGDDLAIATIAPQGGSPELAARLAAAVPVRIG